MMSRFTVIKGSQSAHCCFEATVVDMTKPVMIGDDHFDNQYESVCECFDVDDAVMICSALNSMEQAK